VGVGVRLLAPCRLAWADTVVSLGHGQNGWCSRCWPARSPARSRRPAGGLGLPVDPRAIRGPRHPRRHLAAAFAAGRRRCGPREVAISTQGRILSASIRCGSTCTASAPVDELGPPLRRPVRAQQLEQALALWPGRRWPTRPTTTFRARLCGPGSGGTALGGGGPVRLALLRLGTTRTCSASCGRSPRRTRLARARGPPVLALYRCHRQGDALAALRQVRAHWPANSASTRAANCAAGKPCPRPGSQLLLGEPARASRLRPSGRCPPSRGPRGACGAGRDAAHPTPGDHGRPGRRGQTRLAVERRRSGQPERPCSSGSPTSRQAKVVVHAVADRVGASDVSISNAGQAVIRVLRRGRGLLVLDNCEQPGDAGRRADRRSARPLSPICASWATSREPLDIDGRSRCAGAPAARPEDDGTDGPAVRLLLDRISAARAGWSPSLPTPSTCDRSARASNGLPCPGAWPLAPRRCSVWLRSWPDSTAGSRCWLDAGGSLTSHANLQAAIAWSVEQLSGRRPGAVDRRVAVRRGGFSWRPPKPSTGRTWSRCPPGLPLRRHRDTTLTPDPLPAAGDDSRGTARNRTRAGGDARAHARWCRARGRPTLGRPAGSRSAAAMRVLNRELPNIRSGVAHDLRTCAAVRAAHRRRLDWFWIEAATRRGVRLLDAALSADREPSLEPRAGPDARANLPAGDGGRAGGRVRRLYRGDSRWPVPRRVRLPGEPRSGAVHVAFGCARSASSTGRWPRRPAQRWR